MSRQVLKIVKSYTKSPGITADITPHTPASFVCKPICCKTVRT